MPPGPAESLTAVLLDVMRQARSTARQAGPQINTASRGLAAARLPTVAKRWAVRLALRTTGPLICDTAMLTNLGRVPDPPDFGQAGEITMGFSGPAQMPRGLSVGVVTAGGRMQLGIRYNRALLDDDAAARFGTTLLSTLDEITQLAGTASGAIEATATTATSTTAGLT
jgi:hypothetical protein